MRLSTMPRNQLHRLRPKSKKSVYNLSCRLTPSQMLEQENKKMEEKLKAVQLLMAQEK